MIKQNPNRKVGLVIFGDDVCIIGDGKEVPLTIAGDKLFKYEICVEERKKAYLTHMKTPIK